MFRSIYSNYLLKYPKIFLGVAIVLMLIMANFATKLSIDASAETLLIEGDKDLQYTRDISKKFTAPDFLVVTYSSKTNLLNQNNINNIEQLSKNLEKIKNIDSITSILTVPLLQSPPMPIKEIVDNVKTIKTTGIDKKLAQEEFLNSPIYKQNLVSDDFKTTVLLL